MRVRYRPAGVVRLPGHAAFAAALLSGLLAAPIAAQAASDVEALRVQALAATCANCHGTGGRAIAGSAVPGLAGIPAVYMLEQMKAFKSGARQATVMHQLAKGYSDAQIEQLAAFFAAQPR